MPMTDAQRQAKHKAKLLDAVKERDELQIENAKLRIENAKQHKEIELLRSGRKGHWNAEIEALKAQIKFERNLREIAQQLYQKLVKDYDDLRELLRNTQGLPRNGRNPVDRTMLKRAIRFCHPDLNSGPRSAEANEVTKILNAILDALP